MNTSAKRRLTLVGLIIVVVAIVLFVVLGSGSTAQALSVGQAASGQYDGKKVQVSGMVVDDSFTTQGSSTTFEVRDENGGDATLDVVYEGALPATFGNGITAICTGKVDGGTLTASEMVTKCPSKYESAEGALTVKLMLDHASTYAGVQGTKVAGYITEGSLGDVNAQYRFNLNSQGASVNVTYTGAMPDEATEGTALVVTGTLSQDGSTFAATDVAIDNSVTAQSGNQDA